LKAELFALGVPVWYVVFDDVCDEHRSIDASDAERFLSSVFQVDDLFYNVWEAFGYFQVVLEPTHIAAASCIVESS